MLLEEIVNFRFWSRLNDR